ncbi:hypothetical protein Tco_1193649 [Tanacetum coccineum]
MIRRYTGLSATRLLLGFVCIKYGAWFFEPKRRGRCKGKATKFCCKKDTVVVSSSAVDEPLDATVNTEDVNVGQTPNSPTVNPKPAISARNTWGKYGLVKSMLNSSTGIFSFQFSSMDGLDAMLENGPWFIRKNPLILKKWNPDDGLSDIATKIGTPLMLESYTSDMYMQSWGRSSYSRAMIEVRADVELKDNIVAAMPKITREGYYTYNIRVEYEWKPPSQTPRGVPVGPKVGFKPAKEYRPVAKNPTANTTGIKKKGVEPTKEVSNSNPFDVLNSVVNDEELGTNGGDVSLCSVLGQDVASLLSSWIRRMETERIRRIGNWLNAFSCEVLELILHVSFVGYGVLDRN